MFFTITSHSSSKVCVVIFIDICAASADVSGSFDSAADTQFTLDPMDLAYIQKYSYHRGVQLVTVIFINFLDSVFQMEYAIGIRVRNLVKF